MEGGSESGLVRRLKVVGIDPNFLKLSPEGLEIPAVSRENAEVSGVHGISPF